MRTLNCALLAGLALVAAQPAKAAAFFTEIHEGQYQTFTLKYDGSSPLNVAIFGYLQPLYKDPFGNIYGIEIVRDDNVCTLSSLPGTCNVAGTHLAVAGFGDTVSLYLDLRIRSENHCDRVQSGVCGFIQSADQIQLYRGDFEILSSGGGAVPEPATWGMMILGFGIAGASLRHRRKAAAA
jgi:hypothetical protein